ncbi:MAG: Crp/Fnr family transcriptional regulator [Colwellia sp.]|nr:Crp/Fnr family transcriptional regulator [Colwellia sp.]
MIYKRLQQYLLSHTLLTNEDWQVLEESLSVVKFDKETIFHSHGDLCNSIMFLNSGIARSYLIDSNGRDYTWSFHFNDPDSSIKNLFVTDYASVIKNEESMLYFESLTQVETILIPVNILRTLYRTHESWARIGRIMAEEAYYNTHHRTISLLTTTATMRYEQLLTDMPSVISQIPELYIASYLGITPQSLSRIKKSLLITK